MSQPLSTSQDDNAVFVLVGGIYVFGFVLWGAGVTKLLVAVPFVLIGWAGYYVRPKKDPGESVSARSREHFGVYWVTMFFLCIAPLASLLWLSLNSPEG